MSVLLYREAVKRAEAAEARVSWLEQQREEECKQKEAALKESGVCLKETREFKERAFKAEARVRELEQKLSDSAEDWAFCGLGVGSTAAAAARHLEILNGYRARTKMLEARVAELEVQNARLREALEDYVNADDWDAGLEQRGIAALADDGKAAPS